MVEKVMTRPRVTTVDNIFDYLHEEILSLNLRPGDKLSEVDIASKFGVSRQPVRDAFRRLENMDLLSIRPQRATEVRQFSMQHIEKSRFVRLAIEKEVLLRAALECTETDAAKLDTEIAKQNETVLSKNYAEFGKLDYAFHQFLCNIARLDFAFETVLSEKSKVDRICQLAFSKEDTIPDLLADHQKIANAVKANDPENAIVALQVHLARLDEAIKDIYQENANYFEG